MNRAAVHGLIQRRGNVIGWFHASPPDPSSINPLTGQPTASLGGPKLPDGTFGESYPTDPAYIRGFVSNKSVYARMAAFGNIEVGDLMLDLAVPFRPETVYGIIPLPQALCDAYNNGDFAFTRPARSAFSDQPVTMVYDRFSWYGKTYIAKARPVPIVDRNVIIAWRLLISEFSL